MNLLYTPHDIAVFLIFSNFTQSDERFVLNDIWKNENALIEYKYRQNEVLLRRHVYTELSKLDGTLNLDELKILLQGMDVELSIESETYEQCIIESYFKVIKLELKYVYGLKQFKIKLRNLLKDFGYKRRSAKLVKSIKNTLRVLGLKTYSKKRVLCDIANINIDDMIMIRL